MSNSLKVFSYLTIGILVSVYSISAQENQRSSKKTEGFEIKGRVEGLVEGSKVKSWYFAAWDGI